MVSAWMGKGSVMPWRARAATRSACRPRPANVAVIELSLAFVGSARGARHTATCLRKDVSTTEVGGGGSNLGAATRNAAVSDEEGPASASHP